MASISLTDPVAATTVTAGLHAANNAALRTAVNGGLDSTNLAAGAAIKGSQLASGITGPPGTQLDYAEVTTNQTSVATTAAGATAIVTGAAVVYDGSTTILVEFVAPGGGWHSVANTTAVVELYDGATDLGILARGLSPVTIQGASVRGARKLTPSAASHTYSAKLWGASAGTATIGAGAGGLATDLPMFLRITKV